MDFLGDYLEGLAKGELKPDDTDPEKAALKDKVGSLESQMEALRKAKETNEAAASTQISKLQEDFNLNRKYIEDLKNKIANAKEQQQKASLNKPDALNKPVAEKPRSSVMDICSPTLPDAVKEPLKELTAAQEPSKEEVEAAQQLEEQMKPLFSKQTGQVQLTDSCSSKTQ